MKRRTPPFFLLFVLLVAGPALARGDLFDNTAADPSGYGEGEVYLGSAVVLEKNSRTKLVLPVLSRKPEIVVLPPLEVADVSTG